MKRYSEPQILEQLTGKTAMEIARELGMTLSALRMRLHELREQGKAFSKVAVGYDFLRGRNPMLWYRWNPDRNLLAEECPPGLRRLFRGMVFR